MTKNNNKPTTRTSMLFATMAIAAVSVLSIDAVLSQDDSFLAYATQTINDSLVVNGHVEIIHDNWAYLDIESSDVNTDPVIRMYAGDDFWSFHNDDSEGNNLSVRYNNLEKFIIDKEGNADFITSGLNHFDIKAQGTGNDAALRLYDDSNFWSIHNDDSAANNMSIRYDNSEKVVIEPDGDLDVNKNVQAVKYCDQNGSNCKTIVELESGTTDQYSVSCNASGTLGSSCRLECNSNYGVTNVSAPSNEITYVSAHEVIISDDNSDVSATATCVRAN